MVLPQSVLENIAKFKDGFLKYRSTKEGRESEEDIRRRAKEINILLENFDEASLLTLAKNLYAFEWWAKKEWLVNYWIEGAGGIENLRKSLEELIYSNRKLVERFDIFKKNVKGFGAATLTEILTYFNPQEYGIWNIRTKQGLLKLGINRVAENIDVSKLSISNISGKDYEAIIKTLKEIAGVLKNETTLKDPDLLDVNHFLYYLAITLDIKGNGSGENVPEHDEIVDMVLNIGKGLGFDVLKEVPLVTGTRIDALWSTQIGNIGELKYVFEVHVKGSIDSLIINLMKVSQDPTVQKVVAISTREELEKIKREADTMKNLLLDKFLFWDIREVVKASELIDELIDMMRILGLTKI